MAPLGQVYWRGFLRLQLVSINVNIYTATESKSEITFNQIHKPSGKRVKYQKVVPGIGEVENTDIVKGYQVERDVYVTLEPEEIEAIRLESKRTIDMKQFIDATEIDLRYPERPYYIVPADELASEGYVVIRDALAKAKKVGIAQITTHGREHLVAIAPLNGGLVMDIIRYADELRPAAPYFQGLDKIKYDEELLELATQLVARQAKPFKPEQYKDSYAVELAALVKKKAKGQKIEIPPEAEPAPTNVVNIMDALKKSLKTEALPTEGKAKPIAKRASKRAG